MNIENLSDTELNRAMIDLFIKGGVDGQKECLICDCSVAPNECPVPDHNDHFNFLEDWNLTMPLAVENTLAIEFNNCSVFCGLGFNESRTDAKKPLRAICEVLVQIALTKA